MSRRIFVFSVDAMVTNDLEKLREKPNFKKYFGGGSEMLEGMRTIYPSVTYPVHTTIATGCYPDVHTVVNNFNFNTENDVNAWKWFHESVAVEDIFTVAKRAGLKTAAFAWPVTGCHPDIDYLLDEYWMPFPGDTIRSAFKRAGSSEEMLEIAEKFEGDLMPDHAGKSGFMVIPNVDRFWVDSCCEVIRRHAPEAVFLHTGAFDGRRHKFGVFGPHIDTCIDELDEYIGQLGAAFEEAGVLEDTDMFMISDHGQRNIVRALSLNVKLADAGFIDVDGEGKVTDWRAYALSDAMCSMIYLKNPEDEELKAAVYKELCALRDEGVFGIGKVFTAQEAREQEHLAENFSFVVESDGYTSFTDRVTRPLVTNFDASDYRAGRATHGYLPDLGPQPVFLAKGPHIKENNPIAARGNVIHEAATFAAALGLTMPCSQGKPMTEILK